MALARDDRPGRHAGWVLDGLEVTLAGAIGGVLTHSLHMSDAQVGATATFYLIGAVVGAVLFGYATDRLGRKKLFTVTLPSANPWKASPPHSPARRRSGSGIQGWKSGADGQQRIVLVDR